MHSQEQPATPGCGPAPACSKVMRPLVCPPSSGQPASRIHPACRAGGQGAAFEHKAHTPSASKSTQKQTCFLSPREQGLAGGRQGDWTQTGAPGSVSRPLLITQAESSTQYWPLLGGHWRHLLPACRPPARAATAPSPTPSPSASSAVVGDAVSRCTAALCVGGADICCCCSAACCRACGCCC